VIHYLFLFRYFLEVTEVNHENSLASIRTYPRLKVDGLRESTNLLGPLENGTFGGKGKR